MKMTRDKNTTHQDESYVKRPQENVVQDVLRCRSYKKAHCLAVEESVKNGTVAIKGVFFITLGPKGGT